MWMRAVRRCEVIAGGHGQRDMEDMDSIINDVESVVSDLAHSVNPRIVATLQNVIDEWRNYTKPLIQEFMDREEEQ